MKDKLVLKEVIYHIIVFMIINIIFILLMHKNVVECTNVFFYDGIISLVVAIIPVETICMMIRKLLNWDVKDVIISFLLSFSFIFVLLSLVLVSLDRSYSVFLLSYMYNHYEENEVIEKNELSYVMEKVFIDEYGMLDRRFDEQVVSGNIEEKNDGVTLTSQGRKTAELFRFIGGVYGIEDKYFNP